MGEATAVVIAEPTLQRGLQALKGIEFAEIRIDRLATVPRSVAPLFSTRTKTIATCRPENFDQSTRKALLLEAIATGASFIDIEYEASAGYRQELVKEAQRHGCEVIVSFHDFEGTPSRAVLERIIKTSFSRGADVAKVACAVNTAREGARLMGLLDTDRRLVVIGMGAQAAGLSLSEADFVVDPD